MQLIWVENRTFKDETIKLDFTRWRNCDFLNCTIIVNRGEYDLVDCDFLGCELRLGPNAKSVIELMKLFFPIVPIGDDVKDPEYVKASLNWLKEHNGEAVEEWVRKLYFEEKLEEPEKTT